MEHLVKIIAIVLLVAFAGLGISNLNRTQYRLELKEIELKSATVKLKELDSRYDKLNQQLDHSNKLNDKQLKELEKEKSKLEKDKEELEKQLQAKREAKEKERQAIAKASREAINKVTGTATASASSGGKEQWMAAAGIPKSDWQYVDYIVSKESGWDPCAYNPGLSDCSANPSSACGLAQSLPCGKQSKYGHWTDPVANLKWQYEYVKGRYGGYAQAYAFWTANKWY